MTNHKKEPNKTDWRVLPNGQKVNVIAGDEIALISVHFTDARELTRDIPIALNGRVIDFVEVDGKRYVRAPDYVDSCEVLD